MNKFKSILLVGLGLLFLLLSIVPVYAIHGDFPGTREMSPWGWGCNCTLASKECMCSIN